MSPISFKGLLPAVSMALAALSATQTAHAADDAAASGATLTVVFDGLETREGRVMVALFNSAADYAASKTVQATMTPVGEGEVKAVFKGLAPGRYAIKAFHDLNGNGKLDTNPFGIPLEPFAFSNNAQGRMGPAAWSDAAFDVTTAAIVQTIHLR